MNDLIKALQIFARYANPDYPTHCEHDVLMVVGMPELSEFKQEDVDELERLGFGWSEEDQCFVSYKYGSA